MLFCVFVLHFLWIALAILCQNCFLRRACTGTVVESQCGFLTGRCTHLSKKGFVPWGSALSQLSWRFCIAGRGSGGKSSFHLALGTWLCPSFIPLRSMHSFLGVHNVAYHFRNILCSVLCTCTGLNS